jgi:hypothetical protein
MRPIGKGESCANGAQQQQQQKQHGAAVEERDGQRRNLRRRLRGGGGGGAGLQLQLLRTTADAHAFAVQGLEQARTMEEQLLRRRLSSRS